MWKRQFQNVSTSFQEREHLKAGQNTQCPGFERVTDKKIFQDSVKTLVEDLHSETKMLRFALFLFSGVGAFIAGFAAYRYWKKTQEARRAETIRSRLEQVSFKKF